MRVAFYKGKGLPYNYLVRWFEGGPYSHVELLFSDGISGSSSWMDKGVRLKAIGYSSDNWDFVDVPYDDETFARQWFIEHQGARYDLFGQAKFIFGFVKPASTRYWCSEAVADALQLDGETFGVNPLYKYLTERKAP
jgi:hypothetical protein